MIATQLALDTPAAPAPPQPTAPALRVAYRLRDGSPVFVALPPTSDGQKHTLGMWTPPSDAHWLFPLRWERSRWERTPAALAP